MTEYYLCPECNMASSSWFGFQAHFRMKHPGVEPPSKEELTPVEELPEGSTVSKWAGKEKKPPKERLLAPAHKETEPPEIPEELPEDFIERAKLSLATNEIPSRIISQVVSKIKWHPLVMENANAFSNMLTSIFGASIEGRKHMAKIGWIISEVFGEPVSIGGAFVGGGQPAPGYTGIYGQPTVPGYGGWGAPPQQDSFSRYMEYLMQKEMREKERLPGLPPEVNKELEEVRGENKEIRDLIGKLLERFNKQEEEEKYESRFAKLEEKLERKPEEGGQNQWLQPYMQERDKRENEVHDRYQSIIKELGDKLADATKEVATARKDAESSIIDAITRDKVTRQDVKKELTDAGWKTKDKTKDELDHELQLEALKIIPDKIDKGFDKIADRLPLGSQSSTSTVPEIPPRPKSVSEVAEQVRIEDEILREAERRGRA